MAEIVHHVAINAARIGRESVVVDGVDISSLVTGVGIEARVGKLPVVTLTLLIHDKTPLGSEWRAAVRIDDATRDLLVRLGWTPPGGGAASKS